MNITLNKFLTRLLAVMLSLQISSVLAEDIDIFTGDSGGSSADPNVLIVLDNSSNWAAANQGWDTDKTPPVPCGTSGCNKQGYYELKAIRTVLLGLRSEKSAENKDLKVNLGLMLFNNTTAKHQGGYVRSAIKPMTVANLDAFIAKVDSIIMNFNDETASSSVQYGAILFDAFKYFGGYTDELNATKNKAPATNPTYDGVNVFGTQFWGSNNADGTKPDAGAYDKSNYVPPAQSSCGKNYIVFIGNGFPAKDDSPSSDMGQVLKYLTHKTSIVEDKMPTYSCTGTWSNVSSCYADNSTCQGAKPADLIFEEKDKVADSVIYQCASSSCNGNQRLVQKCTSITSVPVTPTANSAGRYADEYASFLSATDVSDALGQQELRVFAIDVFKNQPSTEQSSMLRNMAKNGLGSYFQATNADEIAKSIRTALNQILADNSTFASASLPVNATNRAQNENQVYIGMFRPDPGRKPRWFGNLKRYQIIKVGSEGEVELGDQFGRLAVSPTTGFVDDPATSFWTTDSPVDAADLSKGYYWESTNVSVNPNPANPTVTGTAAFSDLPDGPIVEKGSVAELLRKGSGNWTLNRTLYTTNSAFSTGLSSFSSATALDDAQRKWASGLNTKGEAKLLSNTQTRPSIHGDVVHSRPLPITYGANDTVIYYGANDGMFRAVSAQDGKELWAFMPYEFAQAAFVDRLSKNEPLIKFSNDTSTEAKDYLPKPYGWDGSVGIAQNLDNSKVWIYPTMRRGGQMVYALDVTNKTNPAILWKQGCYDGTCTGDFDNMGQSWSSPVITPVETYTAEKVAIFGGGYDTCEDANTATPACVSPKGANVYMVNAGTGALIKKFNTERSVVSEVSVLDITNDGKADFAYVGDTGGNIYRIDMVLTTKSGDTVTYKSLDPSAWTIRKIATSGGGRKFFYQPALFPIAKKGRVYLAIGSGDREHPLQSNYAYNITNRFYVYLDDLSETTGSTDLNSLVNKTVDLGCDSESIIPGSETAGWYMDLNQGEQTVTSALILAGQVIFSTNRAVDPAKGSCATGLGEARGYWLNLLNASGTIDKTNPGSCGGNRSSLFISSGMPPSPVVGTVIIDGKPETIVIGAVDQEKGKSTAISPNKVKPPIQPTRKRVYHKVKGVD